MQKNKQFLWKIKQQAGTLADSPGSDLIIRLNAMYKYNCTQNFCWLIWKEEDPSMNWERWVYVEGFYEYPGFIEVQERLFWLTERL